MMADHTLKALFNHISTLLACHDSNIARRAVAELEVRRDGPVVKRPQHIAQCDDLESLYSETTSTSLSLLAETHHAVHWADSGGAKKPGDLQQRLAFAELIGPTGMVFSECCRVGLFFQRAQTTYPLHQHAAEELYLVLSGTALWQKGLNGLMWHAPSTFIHHCSWENHAMRTTAEPMLAIWCWIGDIRYEQYALTET